MAWRATVSHKKTIYRHCICFFLENARIVRRGFTTKITESTNLYLCVFFVVNSLSGLTHTFRLFDDDAHYVGKLAVDGHDKLDEATSNQ